MNIAHSQIKVHTALQDSYIPVTQRRRALKRDGNVCSFCGIATHYLAHDLPKCRGGLTTINNLIPCCRPCRQEKGELTAGEYRQEIKLREEYIFKEIKMLHLKIYLSNGKVLEGNVMEEPSLHRVFTMTTGNNGESIVINPAKVGYYKILGGKE